MNSGLSDARSMQTEHPTIAESHTHLAQRPSVENGLQWGSDPNFQYDGFSCPIGNWTEEQLIRDMMRNFAFMSHGIDIDLNPNHEIPPITHTEVIPEEWSFLEDLELSSRSSTSTRDFDVSLPSPHLDNNVKSTTPESTPTTSICSPQRRKSSTTSTRKRKCVQRPGQALCHCRPEKKRRETRPGIRASFWHDPSSQSPELHEEIYTSRCGKLCTGVDRREPGFATTT